MKKRLLALLVFALPLWSSAQAPGSAAPGEAAAAGKISLAVANACSPTPDLPLAAFHAALTAELAAKGFSLARPDVADGKLAASITDFSEFVEGKPPLSRSVKFSVVVALNLEDAQTGLAVCWENVQVSLQYTEAQAENRRACTGGLLLAAAKECARKLAENPAVTAWAPTPAPEPEPAEKELDVAELESALAALLDRMSRNPRFQNVRDALEQQAGRLPIAVVGGLDDKCAADEGADARASLLDAGGQFVRIWLFDSGLFDVKDDEAAVALSRRIVAGADSLIEDGSLAEHLKQHGSPDFFVMGDLRHFGASPSGIYRIRLAVHDLATGKIVWEGLQNISRAP